jgi:hypothetical protein
LEGGLGVGIGKMNFEDDDGSWRDAVSLFLAFVSADGLASLFLAVVSADKVLEGWLMVKKKLLLEKMDIFYV